MKTQSAFFLLVFLVKLSVTYKLACHYQKRRIEWHLENMFEEYGCKATLVPNGHDHNNYVTEVSHNHTGMHSSNDVKYFGYNPGQKIPKLPKLTDKFFPAVEAFEAVEISLEVISANDFILFPKNLRMIFLYRNNLKEIPSDLFKYTQNLDTISLFESKILHVGSKFMDNINLKKLLRIDFQSNSCINFNPITNGEESKLNTLRSELLNKCKPTWAMISEDERNENNIKFEYMKNIRG
jgi:hypothetical protein